MQKIKLGINFTVRQIRNFSLLSFEEQKHTSFLNSTLSFTNFNHIIRILDKNMLNFSTNVNRVHSSKLKKLGILNPKFITPDQVIFNLSSYTLTDREKMLLSLGLDFKLPFFKPNFIQFYLPMEKLARFIKFSNDDSNTFLNFRKALQSLAQTTFNSLSKLTAYPFLKYEDLTILKNLSLKKDLIICKPDKGRGIVLLDKADYVNKMRDIINDQTKFSEVDISPAKLAFKIEDRLNRFLSKIKLKSLITNETYNDLYSMGSSFGIMYGLPKVHKPRPVPLRPILAAYNMPNFKLAKFLNPLLFPISLNEYSIKNSYDFSKLISNYDSKSYMVSFDVTSLFTNIPLDETIDIILNKLFPISDTTYHGFNRSTFKEMLQLATHDTHFLFNEKLYKQTDGVAMGSPLGPLFANIFMSHMEKQFLDNCDPTYKPKLYRRYVDDTFCLFNNRDEALKFLEYINKIHPNIKFTIEEEIENKLPFLDIEIFKIESSFATSVFRKKTFTGLGSHFYSFTPFKYKISAIKTLIHRAYHLSSNWYNFTTEIDFLINFFNNNGYPKNLVLKLISNFLNNIYMPITTVATVSKKKIYISMPYLGFKQNKFNKDLKAIVSKFYPMVSVITAPVNPFSIGSLFKFKDRLPSDMNSGVVYLFNCPKCTLGTVSYIGCTERMLRVRVAGHLGLSHRTGDSIGVKENSAIRRHALSCKASISIKNFKIIDSFKDKLSLLIAESIHIKRSCPTLNTDLSSVPLYVT